MFPRTDIAKLPSTSVLKPFAIGVSLFILGVSSDWLTRNFLDSRWKILDDLLLALIAGTIVLWYERLRTRSLLQRLVLVSEMNHHVRNALQAVIYAAAVQKDEHLSKIVYDAVERIDWALKEILPLEAGPRRTRDRETIN
jgi:hypothetical protein